MCSITAHYNKQPIHVDDARNGDGRAIPTNETTSSLKSLGATSNLIDCWIKHFHCNHQVRWKIYNEAITKLFEIPTKKSKPLSQDKNHQLLLTDIGSAWYMKNMD